MKRLGRLHVAVGVLSMCFGAGSVVEAQKPIRIGASLSLTGAYAALGQNQHRGYQLRVKHTNEKGGVLGRRLELVLHDDWSDPATAVRLYERLVTQDKVDLILGPYGSPITQAVADVAEKHQFPMVTHASATSIFKTGRKFVFMVLSPAEGFLEGLVEMAAKRGLRTVAIINEDTLFAKAVASGTAELARRGDLPKFYEILGKDAEFVYGASLWDPELVALRAGGLIPIARQYPGAREFVESHRKEFPRADLSYHTAAGYAVCQILVEAVKRAGALDGARIREAILKLDLNTVFGPFKVDQDGFQIAHRMLMFQWQNGRKVILWPEELAPGKLRFPTPPWSERR